MIVIFEFEVLKNNTKVIVNRIQAILLEYFLDILNDVFYWLKVILYRLFLF